MKRTTTAVAAIAALVATAPSPSNFAAPVRTATESFVTSRIAAATNAMEGTGTARQIVREDPSADPNLENVIIRARRSPSGWWDIGVANANEAARAQWAQSANSAGIASEVPWDGVADTPTTLAGYGISDAATTNDVEAVSRSVNALWQYTFGDRAWIAVTNYMRTAEGVVSSLQLWEVRDGATNCVYSSSEEIAHVVSNEVDKIALVFSNLLEGVRAQIPTTAWSAYQSASGSPNPASNEVTIVSTPSVMLTGGAEWEQYVDVSSNSLWVLSSRGVTVAGADTNGYFRIYDAEGKAAFEVVKEKAMTVDAVAQGITPPGETGTMSVTFIANSQPTLWLSPTLSPPAFVEATEDANASVTWTDNGNGTWTAEVEFVDVKARYFAYATFVKPGTTVIRNTAPMRVDGGIVTSDGKRIKPVVSGSTVTWEVEE